MVKTPRPIPPAVRATQARASDPTSSAFVSANAGSGKTHVLVQRVTRLLLSGVLPEKILCITFTKAAAANMAERVFSTLGDWVTLEDAALDAAIRGVGIARPDPALRRRARELFACALETPGGLKVQTIHALCTRLLQQFPFEANVPARFAVLDDRDQNAMMERANLAVLLDASRDPDSATGRALRVAMANAADVTFKDVVREACLSRDHFMAWTDAVGSADAAVAQMSLALGVDPHERIEDIEREIVDGPYLKRSGWEEIAAVLDTGAKSDQEQAARLRNALTFTGAAQSDAYLAVFLTETERTPRKSVVTKNFGRDNPAILRLFEAEDLRLGPLIERRRAVTTRDRTAALLHIAIAAAANYRREKQERGLLDYDDLIDKTLAMLDRVSSGWIHYKLDRGVDHVLIDEAQDTSPRQWDIVAHIISEFTAGEGARDGVTRTIFAVGDEKQSIFSFQGAAPHEFDARRRGLAKKFTDAGLKFDPVSFTYSFRSGPAILRSVDHVFRDEAIYRSIHAETTYPVHETLADAGPGLIDVWELQQPDPR
jgi:ATP-dependent helicase/nuclease subunit A